MNIIIVAEHQNAIECDTIANTDIQCYHIRINCCTVFEIANMLPSSSVGHILFFVFFCLFTGRPCRLKWDPDCVPSIFTFKKGHEKTNKANLARSPRLQNRRRGCYASSVHKSSQKRKSTNHGEVPEVENAPQEIDEVQEVENPPQELNVNDEVDNNGIMCNRVFK